MLNQIQAREEVERVDYTSAQEAWETFQTKYFEDMEELAAGFADDNPLADSASYEIFLKDISLQEEFVAYLTSIEGVRKVNYSNSAVAALKISTRSSAFLSRNYRRPAGGSSLLISNTISVAAAFRKQENQIMKLIGATNWMIRAPFLVEGVVIGLIGSILPLAGIYVLYQKAVTYIDANYRIMTGIFQPMPIADPVSLYGRSGFDARCGNRLFASFFTIRKHLKSMRIEGTI